MIAMKVFGLRVLLVCLMFLADDAADGQLLDKEKSGGVRMELYHRDELAASKADVFTRIRQAVQRSKLRAKHLAFKAQAFATSNSSRHLTDSFTTPVSSGQGDYLMQLQLGTPVTSFHAIADTGSDLVWVQCRPCSSCYQTNDPIFNPSSSSSYSLLACNSQACEALGSNGFCGVTNCKYNYGYGDGSFTSGDFSTETITMSDTSGGSMAISSFAFGCGHNNQGSFPGNAGGLVGLGRGPISLISQLSHVIQERFSYCLVSFGDSSTTTSPLFFGSAAMLSGSRIGVTPILNAAVPTFYYVGITGIIVGGSALKIPKSSFDSSSAGTIFDSGTTITYFEDKAYSIVKSAFSRKISLPTVDGSQYGLDLCYDISSHPSFQPPSFTIHLSGASLSPPSANYFVLVDTNVLCLAILSSGTSGNPSILGNILQQNYHVLYDVTKSQISFQQAQCDTL
ncbi:hypothetical protein O6H91_18G014000 [Diphasiastrum complanatum]|uniref:Uncharacterized protein n=1 Tax=Diphasiastrum complanatum TaxID=34168 RepID=A0ACC2AY70_DIPCM|nr:hypothetical protein O6H91_18G014000 [Diphasiastrum complanatum]